MCWITEAHSRPDPNCAPGHTLECQHAQPTKALPTPRPFSSLLLSLLSFSFALFLFFSCFNPWTSVFHPPSPLSSPLLSSPLLPALMLLLHLLLAASGFVLFSFHHIVLGIQAWGLAVAVTRPRSTP